METKRIINEANRNQLLNKSINADIVRSYNATRFQRRTEQKIFNTVKTFDNVDMNAFFRSDNLSLKIPVQGETDIYNVLIVFNGVCKDLKNQIKQNNDLLEYKCVYRSLVNAINNSDMYISCDCNDFIYRFAYQASKGMYNAGQPQPIPARITNPRDTKGAGCKHSLKVLSDLDWLMNLATCINNYIIYMNENMRDKYQQIIFPAIYGSKYNRQDLFNKEETVTGEDVIEEQPEEDLEDGA